MLSKPDPSIQVNSIFKKEMSVLSKMTTTDDLFMGHDDSRGGRFYDVRQARSKGHHEPLVNPIPDATAL